MFFVSLQYDKRENNVNLQIIRIIVVILSVQKYTINKHGTLLLLNHNPVVVLYPLWLYNYSGIDQGKI